jgi:multiple sugar transport system ATP-binding protein
MSSVPALRVRALVKRYGSVRALDGIDLEVGAGEFVVVLGPTGAGKTTLLRLIAGLESPEGGSIELGGSPADSLSPAQRDVALVFQNFSLYPGRSVRANLEFPLRTPGRSLGASEVAERVAWVAKLLHIEHLLERPSRQLSGGEMQRVAIGRAIVRRPRLFLMDEPLTNLDAKLREELRVELRELTRRLATPVLWVTHDQAEALSMADRVAVLLEGRILQCASPEEVYARPHSFRVARLLGSPPINVIEVRRSEGRWLAADGTNLAAAPTGAPAHARLGIRPEHVSPEGGASEAAVEVVEDVGPARIVLARWAGSHWHLLVPRDFRVAVGDRLHPRLDEAQLVVWPAE